jgi:L-fucose isomerase-like protein
MLEHIRSLKPLVAVGALSSPLEVGAQEAPHAGQALARLLKKSGCGVVPLGALHSPDGAVAAGRLCAESHVDAIALVASSWYEDYLVTDMLEECRAPLLVWALPGMENGALCGNQQLTCYLKQLAHPCAAVFGPLEDPACQERSAVFLRAAALKGRLRRARIGLAGHRLNGMTLAAASDFLLKKIVGPRVVPLDLPQLLERAGQVRRQEAARAWAKLKRRAGACRVSDEAGLDAMRAHLAVRQEVARHGLHALTIGCYPHLMGRFCLAASLLADEGVPLACEGDVHGAVGQYMLQQLTGRPTHCTDWLNPLEDGSVVFTHCGSGSLTLAEDASQVLLAPVRLMDRGACALFTARPGPVTLLSITARTDGYQCALLEGEALLTEMVFPGNPLRVRFDAPTACIIEWIHDEGIGHHWMAGYGHVGAEVKTWARMAGPDLRLPTP